MNGPQRDKALTAQESANLSLIAKKLPDERRLFAAMAMQGLLVRGSVERREVASHAVYYADKLIEELDK